MDTSNNARTVVFRPPRQTPVYTRVHTDSAAKHSKCRKQRGGISRTNHQDTKVTALTAALLNQPPHLATQTSLSNPSTDLNYTRRNTSLRLPDLQFLNAITAHVHVQSKPLLEIAAFPYLDAKSLLCFGILVQELCANLVFADNKELCEEDLEAASADGSDIEPDDLSGLL